MLNIVKYVIMFVMIVADRHENPILSDIGHIYTLLRAFFGQELENGSKMHYNMLYALVEAHYYKEYAKRGKITFYQHALAYCKHKMIMYRSFHDYGAFGDIVECIVRAMLKQNYNLMRYSDFHSAGFNKTDVISKFLGKIEIGINGKSFMNSMPDNYMYGDFESVLYGMFNDSNIDTIFNMFSENRLMDAMTYICKRMYVWENKRDFEIDINAISRGKGIVWKKAIGAAQVVFNDSKYKAFISNVKAPCLLEYLKKNK